MAAPHVAGAAAQVLSSHPGIGHLDVKDRLVSQGDAMPALDGTTISGRRLNLAGALDTPGGPVLSEVTVNPSELGERDPAFAGPAELAWTQNEPTHAEVTVTHRDGAPVRSAGLGPHPAGSHTWTWNGTDDGGTDVEPGLYTLALETTDAVGDSAQATASVCVNDAHEPSDTLAEATPLADGEAVDGVICARDVDLFALGELSAGDTVEATLAYAHAKGNLAVALLDADGAVLAAADTDADDETLSHTLEAAGAIFVEVRSPEGEANTYIVEVQVSDFAALKRFNDTEFVWPPNWKQTTGSSLYEGTARYTNSAAAPATIEFTGETVRWIGQRGPARAKAHITINGVDYGIVDTYAETTRSQQELFTATGLDEGPHTLEITYAGRNDNTPDWAVILIEAIDAMSVHTS